MQTFLPSISFKQSAKWLDNRRLGKQRVECLQILQALTNPDYGWQNHPAVNMWRGHEWPLFMYGLEICEEWTNRGYKDSCAEKMGELMEDREIIGLVVNPHWLTEEFASNHRAILLGKAIEAVYQASLDLDYDGDAIIQNRQYTKFKKAREVRDWYHKLNWPEQPAQRVNDKWPYLWPEGKKN